jgi:hypothetical protein
MARTLKDGESMIIHYNGTVESALTRENLESGEIAILKGTGASDTALFTKDNAGELVKFISQTAVDAKIGDATNKVDALEKTHKADYATLSGLVATEESRAKGVEDKNASAITENKNAIEVLNGDETIDGSVKKAVKDAKDAIELEIDTVEGKVDTISGNVNTISADVQTISATTIPNLRTELSGLVVTEETRAKEEEKKLSDAISALTTGSTVTLSSSTEDTSILKKYTIYQGGKSVGDINIPKDLVVTSGEVIKVTADAPVTGLEEGTYLKLTIANQEAPVYINVKDLVDVYTGSDSVEISEGNVVSVKKDAEGNYIFADKKVEQDLIDEIDRAKAAEKVNADAIAVLNGDAEGSVKKAVADAIASETARTEDAYAKKATTLEGYGITDAKIVDGVITLGANTITPIVAETEYIRTVESTDSVALEVNEGKLTAKVIKVYGGTF